MEGAPGRMVWISVGEMGWKSDWTVRAAVSSGDCRRPGRREGGDRPCRPAQMTLNMRAEGWRWGRDDAGKVGDREANE